MKYIKIPLSLATLWIIASGCGGEAGRGGPVDLGPGDGISDPYEDADTEDAGIEDADTQPYDCRLDGCPLGHRCDQESGTCLAGCDVDEDCGEGGLCDQEIHVCSCEEGYHLCDGVCASDSSVNSCGDRCTPCPDDLHGEPRCDQGMCTFECDPQYDLCDGACRDLTSDSRYCGSCDESCLEDQICFDSECTSNIPCPAEGCPGFSWCDEESGFCRPGCPSSDLCGANQRCNLETHQCECIEGYHDCSGVCLSDNSIDSCGTRCEPCQAPVNARATCDGVDCGFECLTGYHECEGACYLDGVSDPCTCVPLTCEGLSAECGEVDDGCGHTIDCGGCPRPLACGILSPNQCDEVVGIDSLPMICIEDNWCWEHPFPTALDLNTVWASEPSNVWVGGEDGVLLRFDGTGWDQVLGQRYDILRIHGTAPDNVWILGRYSTARWNGSDWVSHNNNDAAGGIFSFSATDTWAFQWPQTEDYDRMFHFIGTEWVQQDIAFASGCEGIWGAEPDDLWAGCWQGHFWWNGSAWTGPSGGSYVKDYSGLSSTEIYSAGSEVQVWEGIEWQRLDMETFSPSPHGFSRISVTSADDLWFAGNRASVLRWNGTTYDLFEFPDTALDVHAMSPDDAWVVGAQCLLGHWDGETFETYKDEATAVALNAISREQGARWAVGDDGTVLYHDGTHWTSVTSPVTRDLYGVWASDSTSAWVVGEHGTILSCQPTGCSIAETDFSENLNGVWGASSTAVWAAGNNGRIAFYNGTRWSRVASHVEWNLLAVHGSSTTNVWAVGTHAMQWDGTNWIDRGEPDLYTPDRFTSVHVIDEDDVWFATGDEHLQHFDGSAIEFDLSRSWGWDDTVFTVFGLGPVVRMILQLYDDRGESQIYERRTEGWVRLDYAPYGLGSTVGNAAALLPDGSMRFLRANDWNYRTGGDWMNHSIIVYLP